ncbi:MAG: hypothetical protein E7571_04490 [Ruminococcaceae bacterium]|nr:hypothetical protein [Oscillospiraceae bacterium]
MAKKIVVSVLTVASVLIIALGVYQTHLAIKANTYYKNTQISISLNDKAPDNNYSKGGSAGQKARGDKVVLSFLKQTRNKYIVLAAVFYGIGVVFIVLLAILLRSEKIRE